MLTKNNRWYVPHVRQDFKKVTRIIQFKSKNIFIFEHTHIDIDDDFIVWKKHHMEDGRYIYM